MLRPQLVAAAVEPFEHVGNRRMVDRLVAVVADQILLADVSDVGGFGILGEQVVKGLVLARAQAFRNGLISFLAVGELGIDVEDHATEIEDPVANHIADGEVGKRHVETGDHAG